MKSSESCPRLRVAQITSSSMIGGGPEHVWQLLRHLPSDRVESFVAAPQRKPYQGRFEATVGIDHFHPIPQRRWSLTALVRLALWLRGRRIQIIHSHGRGSGIYGRLASLLTGIPCVHSFHGIHAPRRALPRTLYLCMERCLALVSQATVAVSTSESQLASSLGLQGRYMTVIPNGVATREHLAVNTVRSPFTIVHVSRFDNAKNSGALLPIARTMRMRGLLDCCRFLVIGDGEGRALLEAMLAAEDLLQYFSFVGQQDEIRSFLGDAGCYLSTSISEGLPLAVLEAQAEGLPPVVSGVPGNVDAIVAGTTGFLYPLNDAEAAVDCIQCFMEDPTLRKRMGRAAYLHVKERHDVRRMAMAMVNLYDSVAGVEHA